MEDTGESPGLREHGPGLRRLQHAYSLYQTGMLITGIAVRGSRFVGGEGPLSAPVMLVGEAPGEEEDRAGRPFAGPSGRLLDELLAAAGITRAHCFVTNAVKFRPVNPAGRNRSPYPHEIGASLACLEEEVRIVSPSVIVTLGAVALRAMTSGLPGISEIHGRPLRFRDKDSSPPRVTALLPLYHPSACLRDPGIRRLTHDDISWLRDLLAPGI